MTNFIHLHTHSDFSLLDGAASIQKLAAKAKSLNMTHLALTDHGNMFGALKFYKECKNNDIIPIIGSEFYVAPLSRLNKTTGFKEAKYSHLILLAKDQTGYKNLLKLSSIGYTEGFYYKPRIDREILEKYKAGLICLSACIAGEIPSLILNGKNDKALDAANYYNELFGKNNFYLELQDHGIQEQKQVNKELISMSGKTGIPLVATNDIHYTNRDDAHAQDILICIGINKKISDSNRLKFVFPEFYFKSGDEMARLFNEVPEALSNSLQIASMCNVEIPLSGPILPNYKVPDEYSVDSYLSHIAMDGLKTRYSTITNEITERLDYELSIICSMGFAGYFLIVWDFIHYAKNHEIPVGPGRGSGAGSLVAYSLQITDIDPLKYGLLFERFLNPERVSMPDFDIDFCFERRGEVIDYVTQKYGKEKVGQIITFGTLKAKAAIRDVARVLDFTYADADKIAKLIPAGPNMNLKRALELEPELTKLQENNDRNKELIEIAKKLEGLSRHASTHAAGIVIGRNELTDYVPLYRDAKTGSISTQFTMDYLEECGLVKMDFLGLKNLTIIDKACKTIRKHGIEIDISKIPENDEKTFKLLCKGKSACVFQFESSGMQDILKRAKPDKIEDLIALNALYRPGPMDNISQYIDSKMGKTPIKYPLPELEPILKETYGVIVYQEQVMEIARKVAGFSLGQADILRRAMGKKKEKVMVKQRELFIQGAKNNNYSIKIASDIFDLLIPFAGYGFNKSHAAAYSLIAYQTAYLKANYPAEFLAAVLTSEINDTDKMSQYMSEARDLGIDILPPDINLSEKDFTVKNNKIIYGLNGIKNVGSAAVNNIIKIRRDKFENIYDFLEKIDLRVNNKKVMEALIFSGSLDTFGENRATLFHNLEKLIENANAIKENKAYGQITLFDSEQIENFSFEQMEKIDEWPKNQILQLEKQTMGFFFSGHPLDKYKEVIKNSVRLKLNNLENTDLDSEYSLIGIIKSIKEIITRKNRKMGFGILEDYNGSIELVIFSDAYEKYKELLCEDNIVLIKGRLDNSRDSDLKFIVNEIKSPEGLPEKQARTVHIRFDKEFDEEESLYTLRDFVFKKSGNCTLFLHLCKNNNTKESIVKASSGIGISSENDVLEQLRNYPYVTEVWKE